MGVASLRLSVAWGDLGANLERKFHIPPNYKKKAAPTLRSATVNQHLFDLNLLPN
jgi:hypothetical protein